MSARHLSLVRHAKSSWQFHTLDDFRRPLNKRGLRDCAKVPRLLARKLPAPDLLLSSDAVRAVQTCQALADAFVVPDERIALDPEIYLADLQTLLERVRSTHDRVGHLMVVGHNPGLTELCNYLLPAPVPDLPTLGVVVLSVDSGWSAVSRGGAQLVQMVQPKEMVKESH